MPGFTIHIATAKEYMRKHKLEIKNEEEFIKGVIAPDMNENLDDPAEDKSKTHYGKWGKHQVTTLIDDFLKDSKINLEDDFWKGYFLHLLTDHYFYNKYFKEEHEQIVKNDDRFYYDYDCLNKSIIDIYKIDIMDNIKKFMNMYDEEPKYLKKLKIIDFIEEISSMNIEDKVELIKREGMEGLK